MEIIATHAQSDLDGFASAVAAQLLHPAAEIVLGKSLSRPLRKFLALHRDHFPYIGPEQVRVDEVTKLVVVDTRRRSRIPGLAKLFQRLDAEPGAVTVELWDHHRASPDDLTADFEQVQPTGAAVTLLLERIAELDLPVGTIEATLFLLGIYADTGGLRFASTTAAEARAVAWLLERDARLDVVNRFLDGSLKESLRALVGPLMAGGVEQVFAGLPITFKSIELARAQSDLGALVSELVRLEGLPVCLAFFGQKNGTQLIARSRVPFFDVGALAAEFGGGGHAGAASVVFKGLSLEEAQRQVLDAIAKDPPHPLSVADMMSSPVRTVAPDYRLRRLQEALVTWRHTGVPVVSAGRLVGMISRRDIENAAAKDKLDNPVSGWMTHKVISVPPETPLTEALTLMVANNVGRLPVLEGGRLLGVVTRSDLLKALYESPPATEAPS